MGGDLPPCGAHSSFHNPSVAILQKRQDGPGRECGVESLLASRWEGLDLFLRLQIWMEWEKEMIREKTSLSDWSSWEDSLPVASMEHRVDF